MVKEIRCYEDSSGKVHKTESDAHRAELAIWLAKTGAINDASAQQLAEHLARNAGELSEMLAQIVRLEPIVEPAFTPAPKLGTSAIAGGKGGHLQ